MRPQVILTPSKTLELELHPVCLTIVRHEARGSAVSHSKGHSAGSFPFGQTLGATAAAVQRGLTFSMR